MGEGRGEGRTEQEKRGTMGNEHLTNRYRGEGQKNVSAKELRGRKGLNSPNLHHPDSKRLLLEEGGLIAKQEPEQKVEKNQKTYS